MPATTAAATRIHPHDFWVTCNRPGEIQYTSVPKYVAKGENIVNTDVVLWISTACHHEPRSEDGQMTKDGGINGATPVSWSGFDLRPRNLWDRAVLSVSVISTHDMAIYRFAFVGVAKR